MIITIQHPSLGPGKTRLAADAAASATSSTVENNQGFSTNDYVVFGHLGEEETEIVKITSTTGNTTLGHSDGLVFAHPARTPVAEIKYNQAKIYSDSSETGDFDTLVATVDLTPDEDYTIYDDTAGTSQTWYRVKYFNSTADIYSSFSDPVQGQGYTNESLYSIVEEILEEFGDPDAKEVSRKKVKRLVRAVVRKLTTELIKALPDYRKNYTTQVLSDGVATYNLPERFLAFQRVDVNYGGTNPKDAYKATFEDEEKGEPNTTYDKSDPRVFFRGDKFGLRPTPDGSGMAFLWYWDYPEEMEEESDVHGLPHGAREPIVSYALYRLWLPKNSEKAADYRRAFTEDKNDYLDFAARSRQFYTRKRVEVIFGSDLYDN
ncbi:MAG: hypothetical protein PHH57_07180 [Candidatus Omnitrophica bacterium]|nr:hypothetical protein [Candidatus Omnitrophota bacterium]